MSDIRFTSPGAAMSGALQQLMAEREMAKRQAMLDNLAQERESRLAENMDADNEFRRQAVEAAQKRQAQTDAQADTERRAKTNAAGVQRMIGERIMQSPVDADSARQIAGMAIGEGVDVPGIVSEALKPAAPVRRTPISVPGPNGTKVRRAVTDEELAAGVEEYQEPKGTGSEGRHRVSPLYTGNGIILVDEEGNEVRRYDSKPGEGAQRDLSGAMNVLYTIDEVKSRFTPEKVGVLQGRLNTLDEKFWGSDPEYATFKADLRTLANTIIQLRTGAAMSVDEAKRIMEEVTNENLPVPTFQARLGRLEGLYKEYLSNRAKVAYGRTTTGDVDKMVGGGGQAPKRTRYDINGNIIKD